MYARPVRSLLRSAAAAAVLGVLAAAAACGPSPAQKSADLCRDLENLRATVAYVAHPPADATVGKVRSAVDKLDPTFARITGGGAIVPPELGDRLASAKDDYRAILDPYGDDEPFSTVALAEAAFARQLTDAVRAVQLQLNCNPP